jgi:hypothetical protein
MRHWIAIILLVVLSSAAAWADDQPADEKPKSDPAKVEKPAADIGLGICMGLATRCGLLPKGICFMQQGCMNPIYGDRCDGTAKQCTGFNTKNLCMMQRGCTWVKQKK